MGTTDNLKNIISDQKEVVAKLEAEQRALESSDLVKENTGLKNELEKLRTDFEAASNSAAKLADENAGLKNALYEQIYNEKIKIVNTTAQKIDIYFRANVGGELNKLTALENGVKRRINDIRTALEQNNVDASDNIYARLDELSVMLNQKVTEARSEAAQTPGIFSERELEELEALKREQITDEQIRAIAKKNNIERFVGLNIFIAAGVLLLIVGAITLARFTYFMIPDLLKGIILFALGSAMLALGEILNRKKPNIFSLGISAGGVGILYAALATSHFILNILGMYPAIVMCVLITAGAFILSVRYNAQIIVSFALIGGYLPMYAISLDIVVAYGAMLYFVALNLLALLISFSKKWRASSFIGLALNIVGTTYICLNFYGADDALTKVLAILYVLFAFLIYTAIPIISTYRTKAKFRVSDVIMLAINTVFSSFIMYGAFYIFDMQDYHGILAVIFAVAYLFIGRFIEMKFPKGERLIRDMFYLTGLAFVVLIIPLQFGRIWLSLGWLAQGAALAAYGICSEEKRIKRAGFIISAMCLAAFIMIDLSDIYHYLFDYKYLAITVASLIILGAYIHKKMMAGLFIKIYKYTALGNVWLFLMFMIFKELGDALYNISVIAANFQIGYLIGGTAVLATFILAYAFARVKLISDKGTKLLSASLYVIGILALFLMNAYMAPAYKITTAGTTILVVLSLLSVVALRDLMGMIILGRRLGIEWFPIAISGYIVVILTQILIVQFDMPVYSAAITIIYVLTAFAWIVFGFRRRYSLIRKFGLGLALLSVAKLFVVDLADLTEGYRIVSYFSLGVTLIAISFVYQYFNKRLELKEVVPVDVEKDD